MNLTSTSFNGQEILIEMRKEIDKYKIKPYANQYVVDEKNDLIDRLYDVMSLTRQSFLTPVFGVLETEIQNAMELDPNIGVANVIIPLRLYKTETVFINLTKTL